MSFSLQYFVDTGGWPLCSLAFLLNSTILMGLYLILPPDPFTVIQVFILNFNFTQSIDALHGMTT
jgi:hypothetical protein